MEDRPLGIRVFGILNIMFGLGMAFYFSIFFFLCVLIGWVTDNSVDTFLEYFMLYILGRFAFALIFIYLLLLVKSGFYMLVGNPEGRKLAITSNTNITLGILLLIESSIMGTIIRHREFQINLTAILIIWFMVYAISQVFYLSNTRIRNVFDDENIELNLNKPALAVFISFIFPLFLYLIGFIIFFPKIVGSLFERNMLLKSF